MVWSWDVRIGTAWRRNHILSVLQDIFQRRVCRCVEDKGFVACLFHTGIAVLAAEIDHSHAGLVGLFLKIYALKERADETVCVLADPGGGVSRLNRPAKT